MGLAMMAGRRVNHGLAGPARGSPDCYHGPPALGIATPMCPVSRCRRQFSGRLRSPVNA